jgi:transposase-like protein
MSRQRKIDPVLKVKLVEMYLKDEISISDGCKLAGMSRESRQGFRRWINIYQNEGPCGLLEPKNRRCYSKETMYAAVYAYLNREGSVNEISKKFGLRSDTQLRNWIKVYNTHGEIKSHSGGGGSYMRKTRQTTLQERLNIVQDCLANDKDYAAMALKYQCSYQQIRNWVLRYEKMGKAGLEDRRGRRAGTQPARTPEEELRDKIAELERKNRDLQMENDLLKKVRELEMKDRYL